jgi:glc operon protein GlcG
MALTATTTVLADDAPDQIIAAALETARSKGLRVVVAVVDAAGRLLALSRTPGAQPASDRVAIDKARTAAIFVRPSREIEEQVSAGRLGALALHGAAALTGGIPLRADGVVVGAVGTSGETPDEDEAVSIAAAQAGFGALQVPALTRDGARLAAEAAGAEALRRGVAPVVAVVDAGGELVYLWRPDAAQVASVGVATDKARTAALFRRPSKDFEDQAAGGRPSALHLSGAVPLQGGLPLLVTGRVVGAIGVSGASCAPEDNELAAHGVAALVTATEAEAEGATGARHFPATELDRAFETGGLLIRTDGYAVDAGRRTTSGEVEYHDRVTDVMHVVAGTATVVTGGTMVEPREVGPGEVRARSIDGGQRHRLSVGDALIMPAGLPHQFVEVSDPFLYFVTKVGS